MQVDCCFNVYCGICANFYFFSYRSKSVPVCIGLFKKIFGETECLLVLKFELSFGSNIEGLFHGCYRQI